MQIRTVGGGVGGAGKSVARCGGSGRPTVECRFVNSGETPEGGFLKGNYTSRDYAAEHNGN